MLRLNRVAAQVAVLCGAQGATDVTGFGLLGHAAEMVEASGAGIHLAASRVPLLPGALALAQGGHFSGGMRRNRRHVEGLFGSRLAIDPGVPGALASLLFESETSGGLLFSVRPQEAAHVASEFRARGEEGWEVGEVLAEPLILIAA
jgi:selenide,water dikinase